MELKKEEEEEEALDFQVCSKDEREDFRDTDKRELVVSFLVGFLKLNNSRFLIFRIYVVLVRKYKKIKFHFRSNVDTNILKNSDRVSSSG